MASRSREPGRAGADDPGVPAYTLTAHGVPGTASPCTADRADGVRLESRPYRPGATARRARRRAPPPA